MLTSADGPVCDSPKVKLFPLKSARSAQSTDKITTALGRVTRLGLRILLPVLFVGALAACDANRRDAAPGPPNGRSQGTLPEVGDLAEIVAETRAILPRIPAHARPVALPPAGQGSAPRRVLIGEGRLLRPSAFPRLPHKLVVEVYLDRRSPPGGYLSITDVRTAGAKWPLLSGDTKGDRDGAFTYAFRVSDPARRLRYFVLLAVPYEAGGRAFRAFEGYLIHPANDGALSAQGAIYPIDFGYRQPEPPEPVLAAKALAGRIAELQGQYAAWQALARRLEEHETSAARLREARVPADQAAKQRKDLQEFARRIARIEGERRSAAEAMRGGLLSIYRERTALSATWAAFVNSNGYRWRTPAQRRAAYLPLRTLRASYPRLEEMFTAGEGERSPALAAAREQMEQAVLREEAHVPPAGG